jgi:hypothetical protein
MVFSEGGEAMRTAIICGALMTTAALAGCVHDQAPAASAVAAAPPPPELVWSKPGASNDEFQRTKAACLLRLTEFQAASPGNWSALTIFPFCMRANGWVEVPKNRQPSERAAANLTP